MELKIKADKCKHAPPLLLIFFFFFPRLLLVLPVLETSSDSQFESSFSSFLYDIVAVIIKERGTVHVVSKCFPRRCLGAQVPRYALKCINFLLT